ncbi:MAG: 30S ribosomal protein S4 [Thermocladium sp.]
MGDPKKSRKKYTYGKPRRTWNEELLREELQLMGEYGLRNKKELWLARSLLRRTKERARALLSIPFEEREELENQFKERLYRQGLINDVSAPLDNVLSLDIRAVLDRRLQTLVVRRGLAKSMYQARQLITHGHIAIAGRRMTSPGYLVPRSLEDQIGYAPTSPFINAPPTQGEAKGEEAR